jgi:hypothetical protein
LINTGEWYLFVLLIVELINTGERYLCVLLIVELINTGERYLFVLLIVELINTGERMYIHLACGSMNITLFQIDKSREQPITKSMIV